MPLNLPTRSTLGILSLCLFNNDVADAKPYSSKKGRNPSTTLDLPVHVRCLRSSPKSMGMYAATDRSLHWLYVIFLATAMHLLVPNQHFMAMVLPFRWFWGCYMYVDLDLDLHVARTSPNAETARKIHVHVSTLPQHLVSCSIRRRQLLRSHLPVSTLNVLLGENRLSSL